MAINYGNGGDPVDKSYIWESKTDHDTREAYTGDRYQPIIQRGDRFMAAPYLPFIRSELVKEFEAYAVMRRHTLVSVDEQGFVIPANGILKIYTPLDTATDYYEGRPLVYSAADLGTAGAAMGDWDLDNPPINMDAFTGLAMTTINTEGVVEGVAGGATDGGIAGTTFVKVAGARFPLGVVTDKVLSRAGVYQYREFEPQRTLTILTHRVLLIAERSVHRRNYGQATNAAIVTRNDLVGAGTDVAEDDVDVTEIPAWAAQTGNDLILPGDLVACDDSGNFVRLDVRVTNFNDTDGTDTSNTTVNGNYPIAAMNAVVGRCHAREKVVTDSFAALHRTYKNSTAVGGSGTDGVEKILTRGDVMTSGQVTAIQTAAAVGALDANGEWDAEADEKFALLIKLAL